MIQVNKSATLGVTQDQYVFVPIKKGEEMTDKEKKLLIELLEEWMYKKEDADRTMSILSLIEEIKETIREV